MVETWEPPKKQRSSENLGKLGKKQNFQSFIVIKAF
jgi:hypothetical protein